MKKQKVSTLTHTTREVAIDFLRWREEQKKQINDRTQWLSI